MGRGQFSHRLRGHRDRRRIQERGHKIVDNDLSGNDGIDCVDRRMAMGPVAQPTSGGAASAMSQIRNDICGPPRE